MHYIVPHAPWLSYVKTSTCIVTVVSLLQEEPPGLEMLGTIRYVHSVYDLLH